MILSSPRHTNQECLKGVSLNRRGLFPQIPPDAPSTDTPPSSQIVSLRHLSAGKRTQRSPDFCPSSFFCEERIFFFNHFQSRLSPLTPRWLSCTSSGMILVFPKPNCPLCISPLSFPPVSAPRIVVKRMAFLHTVPSPVCSRLPLLQEPLCPTRSERMTYYGSGHRRTSAFSFPPRVLCSSLNAPLRLPSSHFPFRD